MSSHFSRWLFLSCMGAIVVVGQAQSSLPPTLNVQVFIETDEGIDNLDLSLYSNGDGTYAGGTVLNDPDFNFATGLNVDPDPFVNGIFGVRNNTALYKTYNVTFILPISPAVTPLSLYGGSVGLTLTDANFSGFAEVRDVGVSIFQGQSDGVTMLTLLDAPFSLQVNVQGKSSTVNGVLGLPGPSIPGGPVLSTISIVHQFSLSPGDIAGFTSFYVVEAAVPEASTLWLTGAAFAVAGLFARRRARS